MKVLKKAMSILLATAVVVSGTAACGTTADAAKKKKAKAKTYKVQTFFAGVQGKNACYWIAGDGTSKNKKGLTGGWQVVCPSLLTAMAGVRA